MACALKKDHLIPINIYFVDRRDQEALENLSTFANPFFQRISPIIQIKATRSETLGSILFRAESYMHHPNDYPIAYGYGMKQLSYNGRLINLSASYSMAIGDILNDPKSNLLIMNGDLVRAIAAV
eukprot:CAMPEP_0170072808 /NCGR_PEP_ID=MMETSP0019_2-20121128/10367_1 /TAXON_ID=98059 /ORGANISM="Dinobryon sp., Strain UTEXLB2267" /LENGTH=124 /DNA_ID=CAMNT_0010281991 /DNA_START=10 /DNA_END=385 /DNA_ORIENTATION=-